jgi:Spy/CpxP family protein refolding chaperone
MVGRRLRGYLILVTVFALGAVAGGGSVFAVLEHRSTARMLDDRVDERRLEVMTDQLALDGAQRARIAGILNDARREAHVISLQTDAKCGHPLLDHRAKVDDRIRAELQAAQQAKFDALLARRREREAATAAP